LRQYKRSIFTAIIIVLVLLMMSCRRPTSPADEEPINIIWEKTYGGAYDDHGISVQQTSDGGYIATGCIEPSSAGNYEVYLIKTDPNGDSLWTKTYSGVESSVGYSVQQSPEGGYIIAGQNIIVNSIDAELYVIKTDENGNIMWTKNYGKADHQEAGLSIQITNDGGYIIAGTTDYVLPFPGNVYLVKINIDGDTLWTRIFDFGDYGACVQQSDDGGYIITGASSTHYETQKMDVFLIKTDEDGNMLWAKTYGGEKSEEGKSVIQTSDGGYAVTGIVFNGSECTFFMKTDADGDTLWTKMYEGGIGYSVLQTSDGGYIIAGETAYSSTSGNDIMILKTDSDGNILWTSTCGGANYDSAQFIIETSDGAYIMVGTTESFGSGSYDVYLAKFRQ
jgi:hypothetical protein